MKNIFKDRHIRIYICRLFLIGVIISFCGWVLETVGRYIAYNSLSDRGFLTLPLCPIYGISTVVIYLLVGIPEHLSGPIGSRIRRTSLWEKIVQNKKWRKIAFYFIFVTLLSTAAELVTGLSARAAGVELWNYKDQPFNLFGVICLYYSLAWGVLITVFMGLMWKRLYGAVMRLRERILYPLTLTLSVAIFADFTVNIIYLIVTGEKIQLF